MSRARGLTRPLTWLLALLVLLDLLYSASQHYRQPLDGDVAAIVLPAPAYAPVLHDPFGVRVLRTGQGHAGPNRFFAHATELLYLRAVPGWLQRLVLPINSVYLACALLKTAVQALLLFLLARYAGQVKAGPPERAAGQTRDFWLAAALLAPLFQTAGYQGQMGIIDRSITYSFFYALPLSLLLALLWPFFAAWASGRPLRPGALRGGLLLALALYLAFHGPLVGGIAAALLVASLLAWFAGRRRNLFSAQEATGLPRRSAAAMTRLRLSRPGWLLLAGVGALTLYSLYLGSFNTENLGAAAVPLPARYWLLARGIGAALTSKLGLPLLVGAVLGNAWLLARRLPPTPATARLLALLRGLGWFALAYLLLLPLGGYRPYRPLMLRYDTLLPLTLGLLLAYAATALHLLRELTGLGRRCYGAGLLGISAVFMFADKPLKPAASNAFERQALTRLAATPGPVVQLPAEGRIMSWEPISSPPLSDTNAQLLYYWGITPEVRQYYQK